MTLHEGQIAAWLGQFLWPLVRIGAFVMVVPIFGARTVPARVRVLMAASLASALCWGLPQQPPIHDIGLDLVARVVEQVFIGLLLGFSAQLFFHMFVMAGQFIAMQMGLGFASMVDPANGVPVAILSQFYLMMVTLLFLAMGGHLVMIETLVESFRVLPVGGALRFGSMLDAMVHAGAWMFAGGMLIALPAVSALLLVNVAFGVMTRSAPQLNIFSLGFPFSLVFGLVIVWVSTSEWSLRFQELATEFLLRQRALLG